MSNLRSTGKIGARAPFNEPEESKSKRMDTSHKKLHLYNIYGAFYGKYETMEAAIKALKQNERLDRAEGTFNHNFYVIIDRNKKKC